VENLVNLSAINDDVLAVENSEHYLGLSDEVKK
jgi:hypothetical protein